MPSVFPPSSLTRQPRPQPSHRLSHPPSSISSRRLTRQNGSLSATTVTLALPALPSYGLHAAILAGNAARRPILARSQEPSSSMSRSSSNAAPRPLAPAPGLG